MEGKKNGRLIVFLVGFALILASVLIIFMTARTKRYTATITEITSDVYTTRSGNRKSGRRTKYNQKVTVKYVDSKGKTKKATDVRIKRSSKNSLPGVGDTIKVTKGLFSTKEYDPTTPIAFGIVFFIFGIVLIVSGIKSRKKKESPI